MSGSSMDGLDIAYCSFRFSEQQWTFELLEGSSYPFEETWKNRLLLLHEQSAEIYAKTDIYFGHWIGKKLEAFMKDTGIRPDFVASHGQTIFHQPERNFTAQIGDGETIASYLPCPLVSNFRNKDVAMGGQGAPLVPLGEKELFPEYDLWVNLGGICNMTYQYKAFDIAPCNQVLNLLTKAINPQLEFDDNGAIAASGTLKSDLLKALNDLPYYHSPPPKSLGREFVDEEIVPLLSQFPYSFEDQLHTFVFHIADQFEKALSDWEIHAPRTLITGGGGHNGFLMSKLKAIIEKRGGRLEEAPNALITDFKEAIIFAFLGLRVLLGHSSTLATVTGASKDIVGGAIHLPASGGFSLLSS